MILLEKVSKPYRYARKKKLLVLIASLVVFQNLIGMLGRNRVNNN